MEAHAYSPRGGEADWGNSRRENRLGKMNRVSRTCRAIRRVLSHFFGVSEGERKILKEIMAESFQVKKI